MKTSSAKNKGRRLQKRVRDDLRALVAGFDLQDADCESRGMGQNGEDLILSPAFRRVLDLCIECKNQEALVVTTTFFKHYGKYESSPALKLLVHSRNHTEPLATLRWVDLIDLLKGKLNYVKATSL